MFKHRPIFSMLFASLTLAATLVCAPQATAEVPTPPADKTEALPAQLINTPEGNALQQLQALAQHIGDPALSCDALNARINTWLDQHGDALRTTMAKVRARAANLSDTDQEAIRAALVPTRDVIFARVMFCADHPPLRETFKRFASM